ncbi:hypothetical protein ZWY2020_032629 [Hordeum vulgare]|nr:hypothetical protein ZWY2020_032629 [Hordeum vulgare]
MIRRQPCSRGGREAAVGHARAGGKRPPPSGRPVAPAVEEVVGPNKGLATVLLSVLTVVVSRRVEMRN